MNKKRIIALLCISALLTGCKGADTAPVSEKPVTAPGISESANITEDTVSDILTTTSAAKTTVSEAGAAASGEDTTASEEISADISSTAAEEITGAAVLSPADTADFVLEISTSDVVGGTVDHVPKAYDTVPEITAIMQTAEAPGTESAVITVTSGTSAAPVTAVPETTASSGRTAKTAAVPEETTAGAAKTAASSKKTAKNTSAPEETTAATAKTTVSSKKAVKTTAAPAGTTTTTVKTTADTNNKAAEFSEETTTSTAAETIALQETEPVITTTEEEDQPDPEDSTEDDDVRAEVYIGAVESLYNMASSSLDEALAFVDSEEYYDGAIGFSEAGGVFSSFGTSFTGDSTPPSSYSERHGRLISAANEMKNICDLAAAYINNIIPAAAQLEIYTGTDSPIDRTLELISEAASADFGDNEIYADAVYAYEEAVGEVTSYLPSFDTTLPGDSGSVRELENTAYEWQSAYSRLKALTPPTGFEGLHSTLCEQVGAAVGYMNSFTSAAANYTDLVENKLERTLEAFEAAYNDVTE